MRRSMVEKTCQETPEYGYVQECGNVRQAVSAGEIARCRRILTSTKPYFRCIVSELTPASGLPRSRAVEQVGG